MTENSLNKEKKNVTKVTPTEKIRSHEMRLGSGGQFEAPEVEVAVEDVCQRYMAVVRCSTPSQLHQMVGTNFAALATFTASNLPPTAAAATAANSTPGNYDTRANSRHCLR